MSLTTLHTGQHSVALAPTSDLPEIKRRILAASEGETAFVELETATGSRVSLLVTPLTEVWLEVVENLAQGFDEPDVAYPDFDDLDWSFGGPPS
ncbi:MULTISPECIES: hypothetical protein [unclassified Frigoribacterium]|uniref:hypothetical protein n=1 Tax=unclassified Frigoribacterium TaxID=2627005 RepID=UPI0006FDCF94|nr:MULTISPECIES: hypothetical protein [unclassified Frigoribacterium]KQO84592.1 hypothetical protein ASF17_03710 [Frigoribacterium sp. Leaf263]KQR63936.1 hypothetical protein ASF89_12690 [Frigoribacterium sp. Leaf172]